MEVAERATAVKSTGGGENANRNKEQRNKTLVHYLGGKNTSTLHKRRFGSKYSVADKACSPGLVCFTSEIL